MLRSVTLRRATAGLSLSLTLAVAAGISTPSAAQTPAPAPSPKPAQAAAPAPAPAANNRFLAPGFTALAKNDLIAVLPVDVELFSLSAGGVAEPKADWTASAHTHLKAALVRKKQALGLRSLEVSEVQADEFAEQIGLHAAVASSVALHHGLGGMWQLPSKDGKLDWSFADAMKPIQAATGARYGLFVWVRDSYASAERKAAMVAFALLGVGLAGGSQVGYASLVDLQTGQLLWFNRLARASGDLRETESARETIDALLTAFPAGQ